MFSKLTLFCFALIFSASLGEVLRSRHRGSYTIVAPKIIHSQTPYHVSVSVGDFHQPCWFNISVELYFRDRISFFQTVKVEPRSTKLVRMQVPTLTDGVGTLKVIGYQGIISRDDATLNAKEESYSVIIQTDKPKYRPGDFLQFRVICINELERPALNGRDIGVFIYDPQHNQIKQLSGIELVQGVYKGDLQISDNTILGEWKIEVHVDGLYVNLKSFQVDKYVLPRFSVEIITPEDIGADDGMIGMIVEARYAYGEPVKGNLTVIYRFLDSYWDEEFSRDLEIDGSARLFEDLDVLQNRHRRGNRNFISKIQVLVKVQNYLTRETSTAETYIRVHNQPHKISINAPTFFDSTDLVQVEVTVTDLQNKPIRNAKDKAGIIIQGASPALSNGFISGPPSVLGIKTVHLDDNGYGVVHFNLSNITANSIDVHAAFLDSVSDVEILKRTRDENLKLDVLSQRNEVGKELLVRVRSLEPLNHFVYDIISGENIEKSEFIVVPDNETSYLLRVNVTTTMAPKVTLFVHRTRRMFLDSQLKEIHITPSTKNFINISAESEVKPGASASINVTTNEGSYVGLMGLDKNHVDDKAFSQIESKVLVNMWNPTQAGLILFTNALIIRDDPLKKDSFDWDDVFVTSRFDEPEPEVKEPVIRTRFFESWLFKDFERTSKEGLHLQETVPDTITSWAITAFSFNPRTGFSFTKNATKLKVFQSFFISIDLPSLVKEGEVIETPVYVFNYMDQDLVTDVTIESDSDNVEFLESPNAGSQASSNQTISKSVPAQGKVRLVFFIRPRRSGEHNVTVKATSPAASDAVQKRLLVEFEGVPYSFSKTYLVHFLQEGNQEDEFSVDIPPAAIPGSESVQLSVVGDVFGPLVRSLHKLARVPYGNCEENMRYFVSNLLVLKYLKTFNHSNPSLETKTKLHLELGYQTQMVFKHLDGSFSLFDRTKERTGDLWVTAYVMWGLQQASQYIKVDPKVTDSGLEYLRRKQREDGGLSRGKGVEDDVTLTAFTLLAFMVTDESQNRTKDAVSKGLKFLYETLDDLEEPAHAAMTKYALILGKHEKSGELLSDLKSHAGLTSRQIEWIKQDSLQSSLEIAAGIFISLLESQATPVETLFPVVRALILSSPGEKVPVHLVALEAMITIGRDMDFGKKDLNIHFSDGQGKSGELHVDTENTELQQTVELHKTSRKVLLETKGHGFAIVNIKYKYKLLPESHTPPSVYSTNITLREFSESVMVVETCLSAPSSDGRSNLTVMEVNLQSGYEISQNTFDIVPEKNQQVKSIQLNGNAASVRTHIGDVGVNGTCIQLEAIKTFNILETKPISIVVYDAYKEDLRSTSLYDIASMIRSEWEGAPGN